MLLSFSVKNYKNFKDQQSIFFTTTSKKNTFKVGNQNFLNTVAVYGANGTGKSNLFEALAFVKDFIVRPPLSNMPDNKLIDDFLLTPFKLDTKTGKEPSEFCIELLINNIQYKYEFTADNNKVYNEDLSFFDNNDYVFLFKRDKNNKITLNDKIENNNKIKTDNKTSNKKNNNSNNTDFKIKLDSIKKVLKLYKINNNFLFLSLLISIQNELVMDIYNFFKNKFLIFRENYFNFNYMAISKEIENNKEFKDNIINLLNLVDINIESLKLKDFQLDIPNNSTKNTSKEIIFQRKNNENNLVDFSFLLEESNGTQKFSILIGFIIKVLEKGGILLVDEIENRLHIKLLKFIIELFNNKKINKKKAQLVFTTHNTAIFNKQFDLFTKDQVFIINREQGESSEIYCIADIDGVVDKPNIEKLLLNNLIGGNPIIRSL